MTKKPTRLSGISSEALDETARQIYESFSDRFEYSITIVELIRIHHGEEDFHCYDLHPEVERMIDPLGLAGNEHKLLYLTNLEGTMIYGYELNRRSENGIAAFWDAFYLAPIVPPKRKT